MPHVANVTIQNAKVAANVDNFPIYINLADLKATFWSTVADGGGDIRVYKDDGTTELAREVVSCNTTGDTGELHVKFSGTLSGSADTVIQIHADGTSADYAVGGTYGRNAVWSGYRAVFHLNDLVDSTGNEYTLTNNNTVTLNATGVVGGAADFTSSNTNKTLSNATDLGMSLTSSTFDMWLNLYSVTTYGQGPWTMNDATDRRSYMYYENSGGASMRFAHEGSSSTQVNVATSWSDSTWHKVSQTWDNTTVRPYTDGVAGTTFTPTGDTSGVTSTFRLGSHQAGDATPSLYWNGLIDEVRVTDTTQTANWITTEYNNQSDPSTFYAVTDVASTFKPKILMY